MMNVSASSRLKVFVSLLVVAALAASRLSSKTVQQAFSLRGFQQSEDSQLRRLQASMGFFQQLGTPADGVSGSGPFASQVTPVITAVTNTVSEARTNLAANGVTNSGPSNTAQDIPGLQSSLPGIPVTKGIPTFTPFAISAAAAAATATPKATSVSKFTVAVPAIKPVPARKFRDFPGLP